MSQTGTLIAREQSARKGWRNYLPFPIELEECACPICASGQRIPLMRCDQFGFPVGTVECRNCGLVYTNPRPTENCMKNFYERYFWFFFLGRHHAIDDTFLRRQRIAEWAEARFDRAAPYLSGAKSILDIGCGTGHFLDQVKRRFPGTETVGIEPDSTMVRYCREELGLNVHCGFFQSFPSNARFDVITLFHVMEHLFDLDEASRFIKEHLNPGGLVIMEVPNVDGRWTSIHMIQLSHLQLFSPRTIANLLGGIGFDVFRVDALESDLDESNLFVAGRLPEKPYSTSFERDPDESNRIRAKFERIRPSRALLILRAWIRLAYFAFRA